MLILCHHRDRIAKNICRRYQQRIRVPALTTAVVHNPEYDWGYPAEPDPTVCGRADKWPAGKRLGGGSAINGMIYIRGHARDYDRWAELGATGWSAAEVLPYFQRIETNGRGGDDVRGDSGPISVSDNRVHYPIIDAFVDAAVSYGIPRNADHNGVARYGCTSRSTVRLPRVVSRSRRGAKKPSNTATVIPWTRKETNAPASA
jgi:choline dehydrogenase-like flavoprotein